MWLTAGISASAKNTAIATSASRCEVCAATNSRIAVSAATPTTFHNDAHTNRSNQSGLGECTCTSTGVSGTDDGFGDAARFDEPRGIFTDGTDVYVADSRNNTIRKIDLSTGEVTTFAGIAGTAGSDDGTRAAATFFRPIAITSDGTNLYVADYGEEWDPVNLVYIGHYLIRQIDIQTRAVTTIAGQVGPAGSDDSDDDPTQATFYQPSGLALEGTSLFVVDRKNHTIREIY